MTIGSAASLAIGGPEARSPAFRSLRRNRPLALVPSIATAEAPRRRSPGLALADDPPRGRILVVADQAPLALDLQRMLREAGFVAVGPAASKEDAERLIARRPLDGAVVDRELSGGTAKIAFRLDDAGIPFVWLGAGLPGQADAPTVGKPVTASDLIDKLERARSRRAANRSFYPVPPPQQVWPRVFPQL